MAMSAAAWDKAEWTRVFDGRRQLPWYLMRLGDVGEERAYVVPASPSASFGVPALTGEVVFTASESAPYLPFPVESGRTRGNGRLDSDIGGPVGVHFYGLI